LILSPLTWALLGLVALAIRATSRARSSTMLRRAAWAVVFVSLIAMSPLGANALLLPLESWARDAADDCEKALPSGPTSAITLGGGFHRDASDTEDIAALSQSSYERSVHAAQLYGSGLVSRIYVTGGAHGSPVSEAVVMAHLLQRLGVNRAHLTTEPQARDTWTNATRVATILQPQDRERPVRLVTTALHMRRAVLAFRTAGLKVCPAPTGWQHMAFKLSPGYFFPQRSSLLKAERALHEWVGLALYGARGHRPSLEIMPVPHRS
jgi:uncharacterized SAM-binding protein YcdF (DUF218 family)